MSALSSYVAVSRRGALQSTDEWSEPSRYLASGAVCSSTWTALLRKHVLPRLLSPRPARAFLCHPTAGLMAGKKAAGRDDTTALIDVGGVVVATELAASGARGAGELTRGA